MLLCGALCCNAPKLKQRFFFLKVKLLCLVRLYYYYYFFFCLYVAFLSLNSLLRITDL